MPNTNTTDDTSRDTRALIDSAKTTQQDLYALLSLPPPTSSSTSDPPTQKELDKSWRLTALKHHPDKNRGNEALAADKYSEARRAYEILSHPESRKVYDNRQRAQAEKREREKVFEGRRKRMKEELERRESMGKMRQNGGEGFGASDVGSPSAAAGGGVKRSWGQSFGSATPGTSSNTNSTGTPTPGNNSNTPLDPEKQAKRDAEYKRLALDTARRRQEMEDKRRKEKEKEQAQSQAESESEPKTHTESATLAPQTNQEHYKTQTPLKQKQKFTFSPTPNTPTSTNSSIFPQKPQIPDDNNNKNNTTPITNGFNKTNNNNNNNPGTSINAGNKGSPAFMQAMLQKARDRQKENERRSQQEREVQQRQKQVLETGAG